MNWYEKWFNTKYYHILYANRDHEEAKLFILLAVMEDMLSI